MWLDTGTECKTSVSLLLEPQGTALTRAIGRKVPAELQAGELCRSCSCMFLNKYSDHSCVQSLYQFGITSPVV